jgi:hypothetical protein
MADPRNGPTTGPTTELTEQGEGHAQDSAAVSTPGPDPAPRLKPKRGPKPHRFGAYWLMPTLIFLCITGLFAGLALTGKPIRLPIWAVAEAEQRLNTTLQDVTGDAASLSLGGAVFVVDSDWVPRLRLEDVRLLEKGGQDLLSLPELRVALDPQALATGKLRLRSLRLIGANVQLRRDKLGQFNLAFGLNLPERKPLTLSGIIPTMVTAFDHSALAYLRQVEAQALTITVDDQMLGRQWELGDGRLILGNREGDLAIELGGSVTSNRAGGGSGQPAQATLTLIAAKSDASARMTVTVDRVAAADLALQAAPLAWLGVVDAPISGQIASTLDATGALSSLDASLTLDKGALRPTPQIQPVAFESASLFFGYDPTHERLDLREWTVNSKDLQLKASGHAYLPGVTKGLPQQVLAQIQIDSLRLDPQGLLDAPVGFDAGALDFRLSLNPFAIDIGQISLIEDGQHINAAGKIAAGPLGWSVAIDANLDQIKHDRLLALWPPLVVPKTRDWVKDNVQEGLLQNVRAGFRAAPGADPLFSLGYDYSGADVRFLKTLPPIQNGRGYSVVKGTSYTLVLEEGWVTSPAGGRLDVAGSVFAVPDVTQKPARAEIAVHTRGDLTDALSLLDEKPFEFMTKANLPVDLGQGQAEVVASVRLPLQRGTTITDVDYDVSGVITGFASERVVPGRTLRADRLAVNVTPAGMAIAGAGFLQDVPFDGRFTKSFDPAAKGISQVTGTAELSQAAAAKLGVALPDGLITGQGRTTLQLDMATGSPPKLALTSTLAGVGMAIPTLGWSLATRDTGDLSFAITLAKPARVDNVTLNAAGLRATGSITLGADGGLELARLTSVKLGTWLDASVDLTGQGRGRSPAIALTAGRLDLRGLPASQGNRAAPSGQPLRLALDRLVVTDGMELTAFRSTLTPRAGGLAGDFTGRVNGQVTVQGSLAPSLRGTAVRLRSNDAGSVFSAAKIFPNAEGGAMDLILTPTGAPGTYDGQLTMQNIRIRRAPALAELINAVSVVGLLDQMQSGGLLFNETEATFRLSPRTVQIARASATGASLGVSASGLYVLNGGRLDVQGVISPIYLLNGIGSILTRKGEGLFGFNYTVKGTAKAPDVGVNPLSILTPGMFREIFRAAPPTINP